MGNLPCAWKSIHEATSCCMRELSRICSCVVTVTHAGTSNMPKCRVDERGARERPSVFPYFFNVLKPTSIEAATTLPQRWRRHGPHLFQGQHAQQQNCLRAIFQSILKALLAWSKICKKTNSSDETATMCLLHTHRPTRQAKGA